MKTFFIFIMLQDAACMRYSSLKVETMALILDGTSEIDAHLRINLYYFICITHLIRSRTVTNRPFFKVPYFPSYARKMFWNTTLYNTMVKLFCGFPKAVLNSFLPCR